MSKSSKSVSSSSSIAPSFSVDKFSSVLAESINAHANQKINEFFIKLSINLKDNGVEIEKIYNCWNKAMTKVKLPQDFIVQLQQKVKTTEKKEEKKASEPEIKCEFILGAKSKNANMPCGELCKIKEPYSDGKTYCTKHLKQVSNKHTCEFIIGSKAKEDKRDKPCGARIVKGVTAFEEQGEFCGKWLCKKHTNQVTKQIEKQKNRCVHIFGERSSKPNTRCTSTAVEGGRCSHHKNSGKKQEQKDNINVVKSIIEASNEQDEKKETKQTENKKTKDKKSTTTKSKAKKQETKPNEEEIKIDFSLEPHREPDFIIKPFEFEDGAKDLLIDKNSGMTCIVHEDVKYLIGIWDNSSNTYNEYTQEAADYAAYHGIDKVDQ
jgi:hypothetical protein